MVNVGKYTIHGCYGIYLDIVVSCFIPHNLQTGFIHPFDCARQLSTVPFYNLSLELGKNQQKPFVAVVSGIFWDPQQRDPLPILFPNPTPIFESLKDMGIVWETYHKGDP